MEIGCATVLEMAASRSFYIAFGANLGDRHETFRRVLAEVSSRIGPVDAISRLYRTEPLNPPELAVESQPEFLNAAFALRSGLEPLAVLDELLSIERTLGRERERSLRWGPRTVDLDIAFIDDLIVVDPRLQVPHPEVANRDFVLFPLADIAPHLVHPILGRSVATLVSEYRLSGRPSFLKPEEGEGPSGDR